MKKHQSPDELLVQLHKDLADEKKLAANMSAVIASRIDRILRSRGMSHKDLAIATRHTQGVVSRWLSGSHNFTLATLAKISVALGVDILEP